MTGRDVWLKLETLQRTRAFKYRGACNALLVANERTDRPEGVVTASAGNHGVAMSTAAQQLGIALTVCVPITAPLAKRQRLSGPGVTVLADCADYDAAEQLAIGMARPTMPYVSPYSHPDVIAGAGTTALEVLEDLPETGALVVPTGGGGLLSGVAIAAEGRVAVVGVEPTENPAFTRALEAGGPTTIVPGHSLADALVGNMEPGTITFDIVRDHGVPVRTVDEPRVIDGVRQLFAQERLIAEGGGAIAIGALLQGVLDDLPDPLVLLVTGANIDAERFRDVIAGA